MNFVYTPFRFPNKVVRDDERFIVFEISVIRVQQQQKTLAAFLVDFTTFFARIFHKSFQVYIIDIMKKATTRMNKWEERLSTGIKWISFVLAVYEIYVSYTMWFGKRNKFMCNSRTNSLLHIS